MVKTVFESKPRRNAHLQPGTLKNDMLLESKLSKNNPCSGQNTQ